MVGVKRQRVDFDTESGDVSARWETTSHFWGSRTNKMGLRPTFFRTPLSSDA